MPSPPLAGLPAPPPHASLDLLEHELLEQVVEAEVFDDLLVEVEVGVDHVLEQVIEERLERHPAVTRRQVHRGVEGPREVLPESPLFS